MSIKAYRSDLERKVKAAKAATERAPGRSSIHAEQAEDPEVAWLKVLTDPSAPAKDRIDAIGGLKALAFSSPSSKKHRPEIIDGLRMAIDDPKVRPAALRSLTDLGDVPTRERLLSGLRDPQSAIVAATDALLLLGEDPHADAIPEARRIADTSRKASEIEAALAILARDPGSKNRLRRIVADSAAPKSHRRAAARSLHALDKDALGRASREISDEGRVKAFVDGLAAAGERSKMAMRNSGPVRAEPDLPSPDRSASRRSRNRGEPEGNAT